MYAVSDEFGNAITVGLSTYREAVQRGKDYLGAHKDATCVEVYEDVEGGESWTLTRDEVA